MRPRNADPLSVGQQLPSYQTPKQLEKIVCREKEEGEKREERGREEGEGGREREGERGRGREKRKGEEGERERVKSRFVIVQPIKLYTNHTLIDSHN